VANVQVADIRVLIEICVGGNVGVYVGNVKMLRKVDVDGDINVKGHPQDVDMGREVSVFGRPGDVGVDRDIGVFRHPGDVDVGGQFPQRRVLLFLGRGRSRRFVRHRRNLLG
jgi:hypothetical protein